MSCTTVTTQDQLDTALADKATTCIHIESDRGVWLRVADGNATVEADGNATVRADGNATVRAYGTSGVHAYRSSTVTAGAHVAVHLHSAQATVTGGVLIDVTNLDLNDPATWCGHHGVQVADGKAVLYKALDDDLIAGRGWDKPTVYTVGETVSCTDWRGDNECGGGLHLSPTPNQARAYNTSATRFVEVTADLADLRPIGGGTPKCKVRTCVVVREVDRFARPLVTS